MKNEVTIPVRRIVVASGKNAGFNDFAFKINKMFSLLKEQNDLCRAFGDRFFMRISGDGSEKVALAMYKIRNTTKSKEAVEEAAKAVYVMTSIYPTNGPGKDFALLALLEVLVDISPKKEGGAEGVIRVAKAFQNKKILGAAVTASFGNMKIEERLVWILARIALNGDVDICEAAARELMKKRVQRGIIWGVDIDGSGDGIKEQIASNVKVFLKHFLG